MLAMGGWTIGYRRHVWAGLLKTRDEELGRLLDSAPDSLLIIDSAGRIVLANGRVEKLFGYSREELVGQGLAVLGVRSA